MEKCEHWFEVFPENQEYASICIDLAHFFQKVLLKQQYSYLWKTYKIHELMHPQEYGKNRSLSKFEQIIDFCSPQHTPFRHTPRMNTYYGCGRGCGCASRNPTCMKRSCDIWRNPHFWCTFSAGILLEMLYGYGYGCGCGCGCGCICIWMWIWDPWPPCDSARNPTNP